MSCTTIALPKLPALPLFPCMHTQIVMLVAISLSPAPSHGEARHRCQMRGAAVLGHFHKPDDPPIMHDTESNANPSVQHSPFSIYLSSWKQCAAETTQRSAISVPPQMWRPRTCRLACHGHSPSTEFAPPTILLRGACRPQSGDKTQQVLQGRKGM